MTQPHALSMSQVDDLEGHRYRAMVDGDTGALDELLSDDVIYKHFNASADTKASYLERLRIGGPVYHSLEHTTDSVVTRPGVVIIGGTMSGSIHMHGVAKSLNSRVVTVWAAEDGQVASRGLPADAGRRLTRDGSSRGHPRSSVRALAGVAPCAPWCGVLCWFHAMRR